MNYHRAEAAARADASPVFNKWITCPTPNPTAAMRLFCLPYAGGGAMIYRGWAASLPTTIELCPIQLPGRENRLGETVGGDIRAVAETIAGEILPFATKPFALFGHSMGALLAFELARALRRMGGPAPERLLLSAHRGPHVPLRRTRLHTLSDAEFLRELQRLGGTPKEVFEHKDLLDMMLPTLRADFALCDGYVYTPEEKLDIPFVLYAGREDTEATPQEVESWRDHSAQSARMRIFPGGHFFLRSERDLLLRAIASALA
jgi:medium-chain acyl-[acyl-carrier-protein] hydrolase